ncbi:hypothetical protein FNJ84_21410 [Paracoccus sp. M683]|uniref:hypothetical protein n=1 Tax=Paracoccus sp. M683 TaxID=2594268 RepID=UPI00117F7887|nr:hypothetical protein [Paracoccus sp. M683]TRW91945.1 hypothetical protein FNJ84_21410 [Paracoccus sp. M683]
MAGPHPAREFRASVASQLPRKRDGQYRQKNTPQTKASRANVKSGFGSSVIFEEITRLEHGSWLPMALHEGTAQILLLDIAR